MAREAKIREVQAKAAADREERRKKLQMTKQLVNESRKTAASQEKVESKRLAELAVENKKQAQIEKRSKAEEEKKRLFPLSFFYLSLLPPLLPPLQPTDNFIS